MSDAEDMAALIHSPDAHNWDMLHPDLQPYVVERPKIGRMIHHPLIVEISPIIPLANRTYELRRREFEKAKARRDVRRMLGWVQRPYRINSLLEWNSDKTIALGEVIHWMPWAWSDAEPNDTDPEYRDMWATLAAAAWARGERLGDELPPNAGARLTVYRGQHTIRERRGIAWSLDPRIALAFAKRFNRREFGAVLRGTVARDRIFCYIHGSGRGENEVVVDARRVRVDGIALVPILGDTDLSGANAFGDPKFMRGLARDIAR